MHTYLDQALLEGVEKAVLFPYPHAGEENQPPALEESFPDLVLQGDKPWSKAPSVIWTEPMDEDLLGSLFEELPLYSERSFILSHLSRFDLSIVERLARENKNLWLGFSPEDIRILKADCAKGDLGKLLEKFPNRSLFTSYGQEKNWKSYKWIIRDLKTTAQFVPAKLADNLLFKNAEELYKLPVNAP